jgi:hypothetical protein
LQRMLAVRREAFDGRNVLGGYLRDWSGAGASGRPVDVNRAGAAQASAASELCSGELESVAENPEKWSFGRDADFTIAAVNAKSEICHVGPVGCVRSPTW